ncbi:HAD family hydrolase [Geomonas subterranea]|uniref:HAD family hydrolase n=1 Tax=Geomonas subterranea TaxID=2847989 RepID=A0ABX8LNB3_9BACT|nr:MULTISPECIES: HAD family hydrolase [Geomonas]QXE92200.1 HAD family hydrolase [Geomonas subterranea]QXM09701.1 HAD family hydrolase [Geomonas subterranea]
MSQKIKAVIYDCDGVLFDSFEANYAFYHLILERFGKPALDRADLDTMRILHTHCNRDVLEYLFAGDSRMDEVRAFSAGIDYRKLFPLMVMEQGLRETLDALKGRVELAVCTNRASSMDILLSSFGLDGYFSCVMTAGRVKNPKPHPEPLFKVLEQYGLAPEEALFVGDSDVDRRAAQGAGVPFVAYRGELDCATKIDRHQDLLLLL